MTLKNIDKINFIASHHPALLDGDYDLNLTQSLNGTAFTNNFQFSVLGHRFDLPPSEVQAVFPPEGSLGDHDNVLPHIVLKRSTLPWERSVAGDDTSVPWLALLLFDGSEAGQYTEQIITASELKINSADPYFEGVAFESAQHDDDKVQVIDVDKNLLQGIMPKRVELPWLAHVRHGIQTTVTQDVFAALQEERITTATIWTYLQDAGYIDSNGVIQSAFKQLHHADLMVRNATLQDKLADIYDILKDETEYAIIIGNRMPANGSTSTVFLVSLENRLTNGGEFEFGDGNQVRLVALKKWRFSDVDAKFSFKGLLNGLDKRSMGKSHSQTDATLKSYLDTGHVPLEHQMRNGDRTASWYHGPLVPGDMKIGNVIDERHFTHSADSLMLFDKDTGMFNVSYSAAWELGRSIALADKQFSVKLFDFKRNNYQCLKQSQADIDHLAFNQHTLTAIPKMVRDWFDRLRLLYNVPYNYFIPEESLLPKESIRFFELDALWIECLLDGAFSIGRVSARDLTEDQKAKSADTNHPAKHPNVISGFILRSEVVAAYPGLIIEGYAGKPTTNPVAEMTGTPLKILRLSHLGKNVLICLFEGMVQTLDIHKQPEMLHFGLGRDGSNYKKTLRNTDGSENSNWVISNIPYRNRSRRVINIDRLKEAIKTKPPTDFNPFTSAQLALQMIEGVEKVRFIKR